MANIVLKLLCRCHIMKVMDGGQHIFTLGFPVRIIRILLHRYILEEILLSEDDRPPGLRSLLTGFWKSRRMLHKNAVKFDVVMAETFPLDDAGYKKSPVYINLKNAMAKFIREDDLLFLKLDGQFMEGLRYKGSNSFEGGNGFNKAKFEIMSNGEVRTWITMWDHWTEDQRFLKQYEGVKAFKYGN